MSAEEFRDWLYARPEVIESWLHPDDYLRVLEADYSDRAAVVRLREDLGPRFVPLAPPPEPAGGTGLMAAIHRAPDDPSNYLVLSDMLQHEEDPRGQLIALQANSRRRDSY